MNRLFYFAHESKANRDKAAFGKKYLGDVKQRGIRVRDLREVSSNKFVPHQSFREMSRRIRQANSI